MRHVGNQDFDELICKCFTAHGAIIEESQIEQNVTEKMSDSCLRRISL